jgi:hypothetical protein
VGDLVRAIDRLERRRTEANLAALLRARDAYLETLEPER